MRYRTLGGTGIEVSAHCLGTMMFGAVGNPDHDDCVRIVHTALDQGINFVDTADMYSAGESEQIVGKALRGRRDDVVLATKVHFPMGEGPNRGGNSRRWILKAVEESLRRLEHRLDRPLPDPPSRPHHRHRGDALGAHRPRAPGQDPRLRLLDVPGRGDRRGAPRRRASRPRPLAHRAAAVLDPGPRDRDRRVLPVCQRYGMGVLVWSPLAFGFLSGRYRQGQPDRPVDRPCRARPGAVRPGASPANAAKLDVVEQLVELADEHRLHAAAARHRLHRGPPGGHVGDHRTAHHGPAGRTCSRAPTLTLDDAILDRIDEIVPPGTNRYSPNAAFPPRSLTDTARRRRPLAERAAA